MRTIRWLALVVMPFALLASAQASRSATLPTTWDGVWAGSLGHVSPISVTIANNKVVSYLFRGAPLKVVYNKITPARVSFGDPDHYKMTIVKTSDTAASARYSGRRGYATAVLTKH